MRIDYLSLSKDNYDERPNGEIEDKPENREAVDILVKEHVLRDTNFIDPTKAEGTYLGPTLCYVLSLSMTTVPSYLLTQNDT